MELVEHVKLTVCSSAVKRLALVSCLQQKSQMQQSYMSLKDLYTRYAFTFFLSVLEIDPALDLQTKKTIMEHVVLFTFLTLSSRIHYLEMTFVV